MRRIFTRSLSLGLLSSFLIILALPGRLNTAYADESAAAPASQLEIPGSFKELSDAADRVTAKRPSDQIDALPENKAQLEIDAEKVAGLSAEASSTSDDEMLDFHATAYCLKGRTASGIIAQPGMIAADPRVLPLGTVVHLRAGSYTGIYTVTDTGGSIKGRRVDVYVPTYREAVRFGRRQVKLKVIRRASQKARGSATSLEALVR